MNLACGGSARRFRRRGNLACVLATIAAAAASALAQQPAPTPQTPEKGEHVHTGTVSGIDLDARLQNLLADHQYSRVEAELGGLSPGDAEFYRGILANRSNDLKTSIELLEPLVDKVTASGDTAREKLLRKALAEDYLRSGDWAKAATAYSTLESRLGGKLTPDEQAEIEMPLKLLPLAKDNPPMTVDPCEPFTLQVSQNPLGLVDVPVFVDALSRTWMLDPTAPFNLIDRTTAREVGLKISDESATIHALTGRPIQAHMAVLPRFTIGGRLTLHNMTVFVFDDADYFFPITHYQVQGVLGYPALSALGSLMVKDGATIQVRPAKEIDPNEKDQLTSGARFYLDGDQIIVGLGRPDDPAAPGGTANERMFAIDAGGQQTYLTSRYFDEHAADFNNVKTSLFWFPGLDAQQRAYIAETVPLAVGGVGFSLHFIPVLTQPLGDAARDDVYGVLGIDALGQLRSYTFDYRTMRFSAQPE